jgi:hypothetical protein
MFFVMGLRPLSADKQNEGKDNVKTMESKKRWYRKWRLDVSKEEVKAIVAECSTPDKYSKTSLAGPSTPPDSADLNGKTLTFRGEDRIFSFEIISENELCFSESSEDPKTCFCNIKTMDNEIYFINHLVPGVECSRQITLIADTKTGCATVCDAHIGTENSNIDVDREFIFGKLDGEYEAGEMHHFTIELVGKAVEWNYGTGIIDIKHIYHSNLFYSYCASTSQGAWMATNPADYIKIKNNIYIFSFVEERQFGLQALFLIDFDKMHDVGSFYGVGSDHITSACVGAIGKMADPNTIF